MKKPKIVLIVFFFSVASICAQDFSCLPSDIKEDSVVTVSMLTSPNGKQIAKPTTVAQTLKKLKAKCSRGNLIDRKGKQIRFYQLQGCWGNPPANYLEIMEQQRKEIAALKKRFTVIEMTCNPSGLPPQSVL